jgi:HNH endonuclease
MPPTQTAPAISAPHDPAPPRQPMRRRPPCRDSGGDERSLELAERIADKSRSISALQQELLSDVAEFDRAEAWRGDGAVSMVAWLTERCAVSGATAKLWAQTAAKLESLPHMKEALADGTLSLDAVAPLTQIASAATEAELAQEAVDLSIKQVRELVAARKAPPKDAAAREFADRTFRFNDAGCSIWASLTKEDYATLKARLIADVRGRDEYCEAASVARGPGSGGDPLGYVPFDKRLYDSFVDLFRNLDGPSKGTKGSRGAGAGLNCGGFRPTMVVHADFEWLTGSDEAGSEAGSDAGMGEIPGLGQIQREAARRLACDAKVIFSLEARDGSILDQKRLRRSPTTLQRIEIARRDKGCRFPGCPFSEFTEVHHIHPWELGGETNLANLITLCNRHHHAVHELGWSMKGSADGLMTFRGPHGHPMTSAPSPTWHGSRPMRS